MVEKGEGATEAPSLLYFGALALDFLRGRHLEGLVQKVRAGDFLIGPQLLIHLGDDVLDARLNLVRLQVILEIQS